VEKLPIKHDEHCEVFKPNAVEYFPATHCKHAVAPIPVKKAPGGHCKHPVWFRKGEYVPGLQ
jgi:hypothetical protein